MNTKVYHTFEAKQHHFLSKTHQNAQAKFNAHYGDILTHNGVFLFLLLVHKIVAPPPGDIERK
ncbi:MAG: hypothetical protein A2Y12_15430 [Planctomycetes bacterium GWF2_42_9]|nr:MAG: hypothetical protein A2Y12_15430 [Planctomycetes bacterium GWF2_42_9]